MMVNVSVNMDADELLVAMDELGDWARERAERPIDPTWLEEEGRDYLVLQHDLEGVDEDGAFDAFQTNSPIYTEWKIRRGYSAKKMEKTGKLKQAIAASSFRDFNEGDRSVYEWSWSASNPGDNYAVLWQHEHEGVGGRDRKLRFANDFLVYIKESWEQQEKERIEEIFDR